MKTLSQIVIAVINFWYFFFSKPKPSINTVKKIEEEVREKLNLAKKDYSVNLKISRWKIFYYKSCDCPAYFERKMVLKINFKPLHGNFYGDPLKGYYYCTKCEKLYTKLQGDDLVRYKEIPKIDTTLTLLRDT